MKYCTKCGAQCNDTEKFCKECGAPLPENQNMAGASADNTTANSTASNNAANDPNYNYNYNYNTSTGNTYQNGTNAGSNYSGGNYYSNANGQPNYNGTPNYNGAPNGQPNNGYNHPFNGVPYAGIARRSIPVAILLSIVTCGIYGIYWMIKLNDEVNVLALEPNATTGGMVFLLSLVTCGIYGFYWMYQMGERCDRIKGNAGNSGLLYLLLGIFGLSIVSYCLMQDTINHAVA